MINWSVRRRRLTRGPSRGLDDLLYLAVGGGFRVNVDSGKVVGFQDLSVSVDAGQVDDLLPTTFNKEKQNSRCFRGGGGTMC